MLKTTTTAVTTKVGEKLSDGCTNAPDLNFTTCCDEHDYHYANHVTTDGQPITRAEADARLRKCISRKGYKALPWIYWVAVRIFGGSHWTN